MRTEHEETIQLANRILDRVNADPDDDLAMLARQFLRAEAIVARQVGALGAIRLLIENESPMSESLRAAILAVLDDVPTGHGALAERRLLEHFWRVVMAHDDQLPSPLLERLTILNAEIEAARAR